MNLKTIEGLLGAGTNIRMAEAPMRIYRAAEKRGDIATMDRAMGYVTEFKGRAENYKEEADRGMEEEKEELREREKKAREEALAKKKEEEKKTEKEQNRNEPDDSDDHKGSEITEKDTPLMYTQTGMGVAEEHRAEISVLK